MVRLSWLGIDSTGRSSRKEFIRLRSLLWTLVVGKEQEKKKGRKAILWIRVRVYFHFLCVDVIWSGLWSGLE